MSMNNKISLASELGIFAIDGAPGFYLLVHLIKPILLFHRCVSEVAYVLSQQSVHMKLADGLLKRILDITYETLQDMGASRDDLERVQQKRNYIRNCYFQAISCY
ncbi:hypothetical protein PoB_001297100 [Plakobranchus ocellatus]|uniref:Uncharacterized protein n=1 Tax=Plakobranchus ocellatus TaxID=259542 RepID=A0AAV3YGN7_9GAST|nr:hypothetical protein PoB_001297100 [Plakobranchus ocellatus]